MYFEIEPLLIQKLVFDWQNKEMYYEKEQLNKQYGAIIKKNNDLNASSIQQNLRTSLLQDNVSRRDNISRRSSIRSLNRGSTNLIANLNQSNLDRTPSRAQLNRQQTNLLESVINEEHQEYQKMVEQDLRKEFEDDTLMLETYTYSVSDKFNYETRNVAKKKLVYLFTESLADMGLK